MVAMSDAAEHPHHEHHLLRDLARRAGEHHERAVHRREEAELADAGAHAGFDLGADIARPGPTGDPAGFDADTDLGVDRDCR